MRKLIYSTFLILSITAFSQERVKDTIIDDLVIIKNDSMMLSLDEVIVFNKRNFDSNTERKYYLWYAKKVRKAYPFAKLASEKLIEINESLEGIKSKRKRKKHIKKIQKFMEGQFSDELKKLTRTEGRILIKLVHRQTGETMYANIKEYRSKWNAFWYNSTAKLFKLSLKSEYHPETDPLDFLVEDILQRSFAKGVLDRQKPKLQIDYFDLLVQWKDINAYDVIDAYIEKYK
jgi:hypothetical protein